MNAAYKIMLILAAASSFGLPAARAADSAPRSYAILSLAGDAFSTVLQSPQIGSSIDKNEKQVFPISDKVFDVAAIEAANAFLKKADPQVRTVLLVTPDPGLYKAQNDMFESPSAYGDDRVFLKSLLTNRTVSHLVLITKLRAEANIWLTDGLISTGRLDGLGFYINNEIRVKDDTTLNTTAGVLAPFAYVKLRLVDAGTLDVVKEVVERHANPVGNYNGSLASWGALTSAQKVDYLSQTYQDAVRKAMPRLLQ